MITDTQHDCSCHNSGNARRRPAFQRTDQMRRRARIGDAGSQDQTFQQWLQQQPADVQAEYYSYQAANPGSPVFNPDATPAKTGSLFASAPSWLLILLAAFGAWLVLNAAIPEGGRRRR